jgi:hypothetical protein
MLTVQEWAEIRRLSVVEKLSKRAIARRLGVHRNTVTQTASDAAFGSWPDAWSRPTGGPLEPQRLQ